VGINVVVNQRPVPAQNLRCIFGDVVNRLFDADWLHLARDHAVKTLTGAIKEKDEVVNVHVVCMIDWEQFRDVRVAQCDRLGTCIQWQSRTHFQTTAIC